MIPEPRQLNSFGDQHENDLVAATFPKPEWRSPISLIAFRTALVCSGLTVVLFVYWFHLAGWQFVNWNNHSPTPLENFLGYVGIACFFLGVLADATAFLTGLWEWCRGETNSSFSVWGSVLLAVAFLPTSFVILVLAGWLRRVMGFG